MRVVYENEYDHTGDGFHQFIDPEDNEEYLYTNFEPYEAHRLYPCFDQPDIKATYRFTVTAPSAWEVFSNAPTESANVKIKSVRRVARGFRNTGNYRARILLHAGQPPDQLAPASRVR